MPKKTYHYKRVADSYKRDKIQNASGDIGCHHWHFFKVCSITNVM